MALLEAITGIVTTMPCIALQLPGVQVIVEVLGTRGHWPLWIERIVLVACTFTGGLRVPTYHSSYEQLPAERHYRN